MNKIKKKYKYLLIDKKEYIEYWMVMWIWV